MKKTLLTIAATVAIATTAQADVTNPVHEAKTKDFNPEVRNDKALEFTKVVKANRDHPEIVKGCADFSKQMDEVLDAWKSK